MTRTKAQFVDALICRASVDWRVLEESADRADAGLVGAFRDIARLMRSQPLPLDSSSRLALMVMVLPRWSLAAIPVAMIAIVGALIGAVFLALLADVEGQAPATALVVLFAGAAVFLALAGREGRAATYMVVCVLSAASFARPVLHAAQSYSMVGSLNELLRGVFPEVFLPAAVWAFARHFPAIRRCGRTDRWIRVAELTGIAFGTIAFSANLAAIRDWISPEARASLTWLLRSETFGFYWVAFYTLLVPALVTIFVRGLIAEPSEAQRVRLFGAALLAGSIPIAIAGMLQVLSTSYREADAAAAPITKAIDAVVISALLSVPILSTVAVVMRRAIPFRFLAGRAVAFLLVRNGLLIVMCCASLYAAVTIVFPRRHDTLADLLLSVDGAITGVMVLSFIVLWIMHRKAARIIDKVFFHSRFDHENQILDSLSRLGTATDLDHVIVALLHEYRRLFRPSLAVAVVRPGGQACVIIGDASLTAPSSSSALLWTLGRSSSALCAAPGSRLFRLLPLAEQQWLLATGVRVVANLGKEADHPVLLLLGERVDGLPYSQRDLVLISSLAEACRARVWRGLASAEVRADSRGDGQKEHAAFECPTCLRLQGCLPMTCACSATPDAALVPKLIAGKYEVERRLGIGGMGVVYLAKDVLINRPIAVKAISTAQGGETQRILYEGRAMAAVSHPGLVSIHAIELWEETPLLIMEYLAGGTLADRLRTGALPIDEVLALGISVSEALAAIHASNMVHKDIKPTNIAYNTAGAPKLLDFGLVTVVDDGRAAAHTPALPGFTGIDGRLLAGTPLYLSPERLRGEAVSPRDDLWALALVMYEAVTGTNPLRGETVRDTLWRISRHQIDDIRVYGGGFPTSFSEVLMRCLSPDRASRPDTATELHDLLLDVRRRTAPTENHRLAKVG